MVTTDVLADEVGLTEYDHTLEDLIRRATEFVETQTGRYFGPTESQTAYVTATGGRDLWLPDLPTGPVTSVIERADPGDAGATLTEGADYVVRMGARDCRLVRIRGRWHRDYEYEVAYTRGYAPNEGPGDVRELVIGLCALRVSNRGSEGLRSETIGGYSYTYFSPGDLRAIPGAQATIEAWRGPVFA